MRLWVAYIWLGLSWGICPTVYAQSPEADTLVAQQWYAKADSLSTQGQYEAAIVACQQAAAFFRRANHRLGEMKCSNLTGILEVVLNRRESGRRRLDTAIRLGLQAPEQYATELALAYNYLGTYFNRLQHYDSTLYYYQKCLTIQEQAPQSDAFNRCMTYNNLGSLYNSRGDYDQAILYLEKAVKLAETKLPPESPIKGVLYNNLGFSHQHRGDLSQARTYLEAGIALEEQQLGDQHPNLGVSYANFYSLLRQLGESDKALEYLQKAERILLKHYGESHPRTAAIFTNLGQAYHDRRQAALALRYHQRALAIKQASLPPGHQSLSNSYSNLASLHRDQQQYEEALTYMDQAISIFHDIGLAMHPDLARLWRERAHIAALSGQFPFAQQNLNTALRILGAEPKSLDLSQAHWSLELLWVLIEKGWVHRRTYQVKAMPQALEQLEQALSAYLQAQAVVDSLRQTYHSAQARQLLNQQVRGFYEAAIRTACTLYQEKQENRYLEQAFFFSEKSRALTLLDALRRQHISQFSQLDPALLDQERRLHVEVAFYEKKRWQEARKGATADSALLQGYQDQLAGLNTALGHLQRQLAEKHPAYVRLAYGQAPVSLTALQASLGEQQQSLLSFFLGDSCLIRLLICPDTTLVQVAPLPKAFSESVSRFHQHLYHYFLDSNRSAEGFSAHLQAYALMADTLYQHLLQPLEAHLPSRWIVIPDGILGYLPFEALLTAAPPTSEALNRFPFALRRYQISYHYSATLWHENRQAEVSRAHKGLLAIAPSYPPQEGQAYTDVEAFRRGYLGPLAHNQAEARAIQQIMGGNSLLGASASRAAFLKHAPDYQLLHIASHGKTEDLGPEFSFLAFSPQSDSLAANRLYIRDLYQLHLQADLVVLSACESGLGKLQRGEGIISLARGFSYAGARSIITTLWSINDAETADLMARFYAYLQQGWPKDQALRQAKLDYLASQDSYHAHPFFWAGYIPIGDMSPLPEQQCFPGWLGLVLGVICLVLGMWWYVKKKPVQPV